MTSNLIISKLETGLHLAILRRPGIFWPFHTRDRYYYFRSITCQIEDKLCVVSGPILTSQYIPQFVPN